MPLDWTSLADKSDGLYEPHDFKAAMYQMVAEQCLYLRHRDQAKAYRLISEHRSAFSEALALLGLRLGFNDRQEFCHVLLEIDAHDQLTLQETLFLITLRQIYHARASAGDITLDGSVDISIPEFEVTHKALTKREFDGTGDALKSLLRMGKRFGIARSTATQEGDPQPFAITILPGIADVLSEMALNRFGAWLLSQAEGLPSADNSTEMPDA